jgi:hypothetical protein
MSNVFVNYYLSAGKSLGSWLALGAGLAQMGLLILVHNSLQQVIVVQIVLMGALLALLVIWDAWISRGSNVASMALETGASA